MPSRSLLATRASRRSKRWDRLRAGLELIQDQRAAEMVDLPGGASGLLVRDFKGKKSDRLVTPHRSRRGCDGQHFPSPPSPKQRPRRGARKRWDRLRAGLILDQRGAEMADVPCGASGLLVRGYKGKEADRKVTCSDPGVVWLVARTPRP